MCLFLVAVKYKSFYKHGNECAYYISAKAYKNAVVQYWLLDYTRCILMRKTKFMSA